MYFRENLKTPLKVNTFVGKEGRVRANSFTLYALESLFL
jgi:hypothetical protein